MVNERLRELRKALKKSQDEFAKELAMSQRAISSIEVGTNSISERLIKQICDTFHVNPQWLRTGEGEMFLETREELILSVVKEFGLTEDDAILLRTFLDLPPEHRRGVIEFGKKFAATMAAQMNIE